MGQIEFMAIIKALSIAGFKGIQLKFFENGDLTETGKVWYNALSEIEPSILRIAINDVIKEEEFYPTIATIFKHAKKYKESVDLDGSEIWGLVVKEISRAGGAYGVPECPGDPVLLEAINAIGWRAICSSDESSQHILRAQLRDAYNAIQKRHQLKQSLADHTALRCHIKNTIEGY